MMTEYIHWISLALFLTLALSAEKTIKRPVLRKWFGLILVATGLTLLFCATFWIKASQFKSLPLIAFGTGIAFLVSQNQYCRKKITHPLQVAPTLNLAPNFPDDPSMLHLLQLLHQEIGLPKHKTIRLETAINLDLGCDGAEAKQFMEMLEQDFAVDLNDYDAYRYFQPPVFDVFLKHRAKGRADKTPLTIGMLYLAVKTQRWDTQTLENLS